MRESAIALSLNHIINPLVTNDTCMRPINECAKVPMMHICVRCEGVCFNRLLSCYKWAMPMSISVQA